MTMKRYSAFLKAPSDCLMSYPGQMLGDITPLQRCNRCILQLQPTRHNGARGVMVIVVGNGHGDTSSKPGQV